MAEQDLIRVASGNVEAFTTGDWERFRQSLAQDVVYEEIGTQRRFEGADEVVAAYQGWKQAGPDGKGTITNAVVSGNTVVLEVTWTATQSGPLQTPGGTIPPSGKPWEVRASQVIIVEDDKVKEFRQYFDAMTIMQQIGAMPAS